jgi:hypothetical protein
VNKRRTVNGQKRDGSLAQVELMVNERRNEDGERECPACAAHRSSLA